MSEHKIPCEVIQDLMPLFIDDLTGESTASHVKLHLEECDTCREKYEKLTAEITAEEALHQQKGENEIDYLKKIRKSSWKKVVAGFCAALLLVLVGVGVKLYVIGWESDSATFGISLSKDVEESLFLCGSVKDGYAYKGYKIKTMDDGTQKLFFYTCKKSPLYKEHTFSIYIPFAAIEKELDISGSIYKPDGTHISSSAFNLYEMKNPYIGDMSANAKLAGILAIRDNLGEYENELITDKRPYIWKIHFKNLPPEGYSEQTFNNYMKGAACVLLATVENADEITWSYPISPEKNKRMTQTVTCEDASKILGKNVKSFAESPETMQKMLDKLVPYNLMYYDL